MFVVWISMHIYYCQKLPSLGLKMVTWNHLLLLVPLGIRVWHGIRRDLETFHSKRRQLILRKFYPLKILTSKARRSSEYDLVLSQFSPLLQTSYKTCVRKTEHDRYRWLEFDIKSVRNLAQKNIAVYHWNDYYRLNCKKGIRNRQSNTPSLIMNNHWLVLLYHDCHCSNYYKMSQSS